MAAHRVPGRAYASTPRHRYGRPRHRYGGFDFRAATKIAKLFAVVHSQFCACAQKKSCRGPLGCSDAHTLPAAAWAPRGRQTLNRTQLLPTTKSLRPGDLPIVFSTPCQMGNFATASRRESDPFPPTRSRGVQRDSLGPRSQNRPLGVTVTTQPENGKIIIIIISAILVVIVLSLLLLVRKIYYDY